MLDHNQIFNINADTAAGAIAKKLNARRLIIMSDVEGVLDDNKKLISEIDTNKINELIQVASESSEGLVYLVENLFRYSSTEINQTPNFNFFLNRSNFVEYNWYNPDYKNQLINSLNFYFGHPKWGKLEGQYELLNNYTYFRNLQPGYGQDPDSGGFNKKEEERRGVEEREKCQI